METTRIVRSGTAGTLDVLGPTVELLNAPFPATAAYCVMKGVVPPGGVAPLHSHPDDESFFQLSGTIDVLIEEERGFRWETVREGDFVHVPSGIKHAWRNASDTPAVSVIVTTQTLGKFFAEVGVPVNRDAMTSASASAPERERLEHFMRTAARYGHWLGTPDENAAVGIMLPS